MKTDGLTRMLDFLVLLQEKGIDYKIDQQRPDALMVSLALVGKRIEVEFFANEIEYSVFNGDEAVSTNEKALADLIKGMST
jgi:hypothetical protein